MNGVVSINPESKIKEEKSNKKDNCSFANINRVPILMIEIISMFLIITPDNEDLK